MIDRTGILKNSPLIFTLASIRFASWPLMAKKIDEIHDELRELTPLIQHIQIQQVGTNPLSAMQVEPAASTVWMLMSSDRSLGIHLAPDQVLVFSSKYTRYTDFQTVLDKSIDVLLKHMRFVDIVNLGVRYVDRINIREGEAQKDYITDCLLPANFSGFETMGGISMGTYKSPKAELQVRCISHPDALAVPDDMISILAMSQEPGSPLKLEKLTNSILLDIDAHNNYLKPERLTKQAVLKQLDSLHQEANAFFRHESICTEHAFKVWKGEV